MLLDIVKALEVIDAELGKDGASVYSAGVKAAELLGVTDPEVIGAIVLLARGVNEMNYYSA